MNRHLITLTALLASLLLNGRALAQNQKTSDSTEKPKETPTLPITEKTRLTTEQLEARFKATLTKATMAGRWCAIKDGALSPEKEDKYTIIGITKMSGDMWVINARIQYNKKDMVAPIPVQVKWAGDTPVIIVEKLPMPGGGTYSARVLVFENTYAGTWNGGDHGGLLNGIITNEKE